MKTYVSVDMEGITGVADVTFVTYAEKHYERGQQLMTGDTNKVLQAAFEYGCDEALVNDSHGRMNNMIVEKLDPRARIISGTNKPLCMVEGLDDSFDCAMFIGYHARASQKGVLSHSMTYSIKNMYINNTVIGEFGFNAYLAGYYGVPVVLVSGDDRIAEEAELLIPGITTAVVKTFVSHVSALCLTPEESGKLLMEQTNLALERRHLIQPLLPPDRPLLRVEFAGYTQAEWAAFMPGAQLEEGTTVVRFQADTIVEAYRALLTMIKLAS